MVLLISYDLDNHQRPEAYEAIRKMIEGNSLSFKKILYSQWLVQTIETPDQWSNRLASLADSDKDYWFIVPVKHPYQGWLPAPIWDWLRPKI